MQIKFLGNLLQVFGIGRVLEWISPEHKKWPVASPAWYRVRASNPDFEESIIDENRQLEIIYFKLPKWPG
jgi:hypothetical protein